ncbi:ATP-binding cassette domain-containing protein [Streptodolium elevatio]
MTQPTPVPSSPAVPAQAARESQADPPEPADRAGESGQELRYVGSAGDTEEALRQVTTRAMAARLPRLIAQALRLAWAADPRASAALLVCQVLAGILEAFGLLATTSTITAVISSGEIGDRLRDAAPSLVVLAAAVGLRALLGVAVVALSARVTPRLTREAETLLLDASARAELVAYDHPGFNNRWDSADRGVQSMRGLIPQTQDVIAACASLAAAATVLTVLHPVLLPLLLFGAVPRGLAAVRAARIEYQTTIDTLNERRILGMMRWHISDKHWADQLRSSTIAPFLLDRYQRASDRVQQVTQDAAWRTAKVGTLGAAAGGVAAGLVWGAVVFLLATDRMSVAAAGTAVIGLRTVSTALGGIVASGSRLYSVGLYLDDWDLFLKEAGGHRMRRGSLVLKQPSAFRAEGAGFTYPGKDRAAVTGIDLDVPVGKVVALVGENGSGKSTLAKLLCGLYLPTEGRVTWDGHDVRELDPHELWARLGYVPQEIARWPLQAIDNVTLGQLRSEHEVELSAALAASGTDQVVAELKFGLSTLLAPDYWNGTGLSGGQWQRVGLARAFYRDARLLVLDEPTSALDPRAENRLFTSLRTLAKDRAVVLVTHRLANVAKADEIVVMEHGRVRERGCCDELLAMPRATGLFRELWELQGER